MITRLSTQTLQHMIRMQRNQVGFLTATINEYDATDEINLGMYRMRHELSVRTRCLSGLEAEFATRHDTF